MKDSESLCSPRIILTCYETLWGSTDDAMCLFYVSCLHSSLNLGLGQVVDTKIWIVIKVPARTTLQDATKALLTRLFLLAKAHGISGISGTVWWIQCISRRGLRMMSHVPPCRATVPQHFSFHSSLSRNLRGPCSSSACEFGWRNSNQFRSTSSCNKLRQQVHIQVHLYVHYVYVQCWCSSLVQFFEPCRVKSHW